MSIQLQLSWLSHYGTWYLIQTLENLSTLEENLTTLERPLLQSIFFQDCSLEIGRYSPTLVGDAFVEQRVFFVNQKYLIFQFRIMNICIIHIPERVQTLLKYDVESFLDQENSIYFLIITFCILF